MFSVEMYPADEGDCLVVTYGRAEAPNRILIDGGRKATWSALKSWAEKLPESERTFELLIVTHVDRDHIEGVLELSADDQNPLHFKDVWFNGYHHLNNGAFEVFSPVQGEVLSAALVSGHRRGKLTWNGAFSPDFKRAAALTSDDKPRTLMLPGGMMLTVLSPSLKKLEKLAPKWETACQNAGMVAGQSAQAPPPEGYEFFSAIDIDTLADEPFQADYSEPNGSSIAVLAEYEGKRALLAGDAHVDVLEKSIALLAPNGPLELDLLKLPHHGSRKNLSRPLLEAIRCTHYLISTSGAYFKHPDPIAMSRLIKYGGPGKQIWFNYSSEETEIWDVEEWKHDWDYAVHYPTAGSDGYQKITL